MQLPASPRTPSRSSARATRRPIKIAEVGAIPSLVALLGTPIPELQANAAECLGNLSDKSLDNQASIARTGAIVPLYLVREGATDQVKEQASAALWSLSNRTSQQGHGRQARRHRAAHLAHRGGDDRQLARAGDGRAREPLLEARGEPRDDRQAIVARMINRSALVATPGGAERVLSAVSKMCNGSSSNQAAIAKAGGVPPLIMWLSGGGERRPRAPSMPRRRRRRRTRSSRWSRATRRCRRSSAVNGISPLIEPPQRARPRRRRRRRASCGTSRATWRARPPSPRPADAAADARAARGDDGGGGGRRRRRERRRRERRRRRRRERRRERRGGGSGGGGGGVHDSVHAQELAATVISRLLKSNPSVASSFNEMNGVDALVKMLLHGHPRGSSRRRASSRRSHSCQSTTTRSPSRMGASRPSSASDLLRRGHPRSRRACSPTSRSRPGEAGGRERRAARRAEEASAERQHILRGRREAADHDALVGVARLVARRSQDLGAHRQGHRRQPRRRGPRRRCRSRTRSSACRSRPRRRSPTSRAATPRSRRRSSTRRRAAAAQPRAGTAGRAGARDARDLPLHDGRPPGPHRRGGAAADLVL